MAENQKYTALSKLGIQSPLVLAPMAGISTPALVAAVSNAGCLGSFGLGLASGREVKETAKALRSLTNKPFALNLFVPPTADHFLTQKQNLAIETVCRYWSSIKQNVDGSLLHVDASSPTCAELQDQFEEAIEAIIEEEIPILSFTFGIPHQSLINKLKNAGVVLIGTATNVKEAVKLEQSGVDIITAQGLEAGGHRGTWYDSGDYRQSMMGMAALVSQVVRAVKIPVMAAGGIGCGGGITAALALGAQAAVIGTAFMTCIEAGTHGFHKAALTSQKVQQSGTTTVSQAVTGKPARVLILPQGTASYISDHPINGSDDTSDVCGLDIEASSFLHLTAVAHHLPNHWFSIPAKQVAASVVRQWHTQKSQNKDEADDTTGLSISDLQACQMYPQLWAGQNFALCRSNISAAELCDTLLSEARQAVNSIYMVEDS